MAERQNARLRFVALASLGLLILMGGCSRTQGPPKQEGGVTGSDGFTNFNTPLQGANTAPAVNAFSGVPASTQFLSCRSRRRMPMAVSSSRIGTLHLKVRASDSRSMSSSRDASFAPMLFGPSCSARRERTTATGPTRRSMRELREAWKTRSLRARANCALKCPLSRKAVFWSAERTARLPDR